VLEVDHEEARQMIRDGRVVDGKTVMLLQRALLDDPFTPRGPVHDTPAG
jgi:hypothetical protein